MLYTLNVANKVHVNKKRNIYFLLASSEAWIIITIITIQMCK